MDELAVIAVLLLVGSSFAIGFYWARTLKQVKDLTAEVQQKLVKEKRTEAEELPEQRSSFIDPNSIEYQIAMQREKREELARRVGQDGA